MKNQYSVIVKNVSKSFEVPHTRRHTIKSNFLNLFKRGDGKQTRIALKKIDFQIQEGEFFGIVGRNGSGKSTLLKMIAGIYQPTKGSIEISGKLVPFIELGVGFNPELSGRENVYLNGAILGFSKQEIDERYDRIVAFAELEDFMDEKLKNYSSGMQVRLAFSCATMAKADVLLVDEVLAVGDADFQRKCFDYFRKLKKDKKTVIFVSHDMNAVREYCDRAILIEDGDVIEEGDSEKVANKYSKLFLDDEKAQSNYLEGERWGDKKVITKSIKTSKSTFKENDKILIKQLLFANEDTDKVVAGFRVKTATDELLMGTNTIIKKKKIGNLKKGDVVEVAWEFDNLLSDGQYFIDPAVVHGNSGTVVADWWEDAVGFRVKKAEIVPYPINPEIIVKLSKVN